MRFCQNALILSVSLLSVVAGARIVTEDYAAIGRRNVFRLSPPKLEPRLEEVKPELPQVSLQGVTTLLDSRQALLKIQTKTTATEVNCILAEGQVRDGIKVLRIDMEFGAVWLTNQGTEQILALER